MRPERAGSFAAFVAGVVAAASQAATAGNGDVPASAVDALFSSWSESTPGCAVGVSEDGRAVLERAYGMADLEQGTRNRTDTIFEAGSVSKQFTAAAVLLLARDGKLSLDDPVRKYIPEVPDYGTPITIREMLQHTSGLRDWGSVEDVAGWPRGTRVYTHAHVLDIVSRQRRLNFTPGTNWSYSNTGYNLAAILVTRVAGEPFADFTRRRIFEPLGMTRTSWRDDFARVVPGRAIAYAESEGRYRMDMPFENIHGNGGLLTTVGDLLRWNANFLAPKVGDAAFLELETTPGRLANGVQHDYAFGLTVSTYKGLPEIRHSGTTGSYRAYLSQFPKQRLSVAVLCNAGDSTPGKTLHAVADLYLGASMKPGPMPAPAELSTAALDALTGLYRKSETGDAFRIERDGKTLRVSGEVLTAESALRFTDAYGQSIAFDGRGAAVLDYGNGTSEAVERMPAATPTGAELAALAGRYHSEDAEVTLEVRVRDGQLEIARRPADVFALEPLYVDAFASDLGTIIFRRDAAGAPAEFSVVLDRVWDHRFRRVQGGQP
jgi:CubicO group peptidase (beta-lactamase class C family)